MHFYRARRGATMDPGPQRSGPSRRSLADRFWEKVDKTPGQGPNGDCWEWKGARQPNGYGKLTSGGDRGKTLMAHRVALELAGVPLSEGAYACHHCDNPPCVREDHLYAGMPTDNVADMVARGRARFNGSRR